MLNREIMHAPTDIYAEHWQKARATAEQAGLEIIEHGWEQHVVIDHAEQLVFRYPRHQAAADKLADEVAVLQGIHTQQWPIALPTMREHNPICTIYDYIPGDVLSKTRIAEMSEADLQHIGGSLGTFLAQLHRLDSAIVEQKQTKHSTSLLDYYQQRVEEGHDSSFYEHAHAALTQLLDVPQALADTVTHGDLHGLNIIVASDHHELVGVIDLSEMEIGDPHQDFRKLFMADPRLLEPAIATYQQAGGQNISADRARTWAYINEWANLCHFYQTPDNPTYQRAVNHLTAWQQL